MEQTTELSAPVRSFTEHVREAVKTTGCMIAMLAVIVVLVVRKMFS